jgi:predicted RNase H-like HicB family nuclease
MRKVIIHRSDPDEEAPYWVECPSLGITSIGENIYDAFHMIYEIIALHIEDLIVHGYPVPSEDSATVAQSLVLDI